MIKVYSQYINFCPKRHTVTTCAEENESPGDGVLGGKESPISPHNYVALKVVFNPIREPHITIRQGHIVCVGVLKVSQG